MRKEKLSWGSMEEIVGHSDPMVGKVSEHILLAYETALKSLRQMARDAMEAKLCRPLPQNSLDRYGFDIVYAEVGSGRKIELRFDASHERSKNESAFTISISKDPYDCDGEEIVFFLPSSPEYAGHQHPYSRESHTPRWRPSEKELSSIERVLKDFRDGEMVSR